MRKRTNKFVSIIITALIITHVFGNVFVIAQDNNFGESYTPTIEDSFSDNEIIVLVTSERNATEYTIADFEDVGCAAVEQLSRNVTESDSGTILKLTLSEHSKENVLNVIEILKLRDDIVFADPNYELSYNSMTNDEYAISHQWAIDTLSLPAAWDITTGSSAVKVGVIDSGIDGNHPDLVNRIDQNLSKCFTDSTTGALYDPVGHGTRVAGIIGAQGNNSIGITGVCRNVRLVSLRVSTDTGAGSVDAIIEAIEYADEIGLPIINASLGVAPSSGKIGTLFAAIRDYDGLFVCAAGNNGNNTDIFPEYPNSFRLPNLISVGTSNSLDQWRYNSNYGAVTVDIFAPGENIYTTAVGGSYMSVSDSSYASPHVAGVAALMLSVNPDLDGPQLKKIIMESVDVVYFSDGTSVFGDLCVSGGRLNAYKAVYNSHPHDYYYVDEYCHSFNCDECELSVIEDAHNFAFVGVDPSSDYHHIKECICGYSTTEYHGYTIYVNSPNAPYHYAYCGCGDYELDLHVLLQANSSGVNYDWYCMYCGITYVGDYPSLSMSTNATVQLLTETGSYVLSNGVIVLSNEDAALVEAGLLDPYELVENITVPAGPGHVTE